MSRPPLVTSARRRRSGGRSSLDPPASADERRRARAVARAVATELVRRGATAVVLAGSWARGDARRASDIDLWAIDGGDRVEALWRPPFLVTVKHTSTRASHQELRDPSRVGGSVPGWRTAVPLVDPRGVAARLRAEARGFRWSRHRAALDRWVSREVAGWAEEVIKLVRALAEGERATAAVQRNLLAEHLGFLVAVHRRRFWDSEHRFWERIGREVGGRWAAAQRRALGVAGASFDASCRAALRLYAETVEQVQSALRPDHAAIARWAIGVAGAGRRPRLPRRRP